MWGYPWWEANLQKTIHSLNWKFYLKINAISPELTHTTQLKQYEYRYFTYGVFNYCWIMLMSCSFLSGTSPQSLEPYEPASRGRWLQLCTSYFLYPSPHAHRTVFSTPLASKWSWHYYACLCCDWNHFSAEAREAALSTKLGFQLQLYPNLQLSAISVVERRQVLHEEAHRLKLSILDKNEFSGHACMHILTNWKGFWEVRILQK